MELYDRTSYELSMRLTRRYSTSFSMSSQLFHGSIRKHIYAIYGLVRIADEIVDTHKSETAEADLLSLKKDVYRAIKSGYSVNPIVHSFALTAAAYGIGKELIEPFFESMAMDLSPRNFDQETYERYIYGSAEVVGLMCLRVFVGGDDNKYQSLEAGARSLGAAYQKVNFLRDIKADHDELGRVYFPGVKFSKFSEKQKTRIIKDIEEDFKEAESAVSQLPRKARRAVRASIYYYEALLGILSRSSVQEIKKRRVSVPKWRKLGLLAKAAVR